MAGNPGGGAGSEAGRGGSWEVRISQASDYNGEKELHSTGDHRDRVDGRPQLSCPQGRSWGLIHQLPSAIRERP